MISVLKRPDSMSENTHIHTAVNSRVKNIIEPVNPADVMLDIKNLKKVYPTPKIYFHYRSFRLW
jgi:hypothetical protein